MEDSREEDIPAVIAQALRLEGWDTGSDVAPDVAEAGRTALELNARSSASPEEELADAREAFRECFQARRARG